MAILDEESLLATCACIDLNPVAAGIAEVPETSEYTSIKQRVEHVQQQASTFGWTKFVGEHGTNIGMRTFGASAPLKDLLVAFGFTVDRVAQAARDQLKKGQR